MSPFAKLESVIPTFETEESAMLPFANIVESISELEINASSRMSSSISMFVKIRPFAVP